jgi:hypothetical protein
MKEPLVAHTETLSREIETRVTYLPPLRQAAPEAPAARLPVGLGAGPREVAGHTPDDGEPIFGFS